MGRWQRGSKSPQGLLIKLASGGLGTRSLNKKEIGCRGGILLKIVRIFHFSGIHGESNNMKNKTKTPI